MHGKVEENHIQSYFDLLVRLSYLMKITEYDAVMMILSRTMKEATSWVQDHYF
jgi:hypothetical protein